MPLSMRDSLLAFILITAVHFGQVFGHHKRALLLAANGLLHDCLGGGYAASRRARL